MRALASAIGARRRLAIGVWVALVVASAPFAARQTAHLTGNGFNVPGSPSDAVREALNRDFGVGVRSQLAVVLVADSTASPGSLRAAVGRVGEAARRTPHAVLPAASRDAALAAASRTQTLIVPLALDVGEDGATDVATRLRDALDVGRTRGGVTAHLVGQGALTAGLQDLNKRNLETAEVVGFPVVFAILLAIFGSLTAAALPFVLGVGAVAVTGAAIFFLSQALDMFTFVTTAASMIGIGVAVDYSLFVVWRFREEIAAGAAADDARACAMATSGVAVLFSGATVIVSLSGLWLVHSNAIRSTALGAMLVVAVAVLAAVTLLPALLGQRLAKPRRERAATRFWERWTRRVTARPALSAIAAVALMLALALPALGMRMRTGALQQLPAGSETRAGFDAAARVTGPGAFSSIQVLTSATPAVTAGLRDAIAADAGVARVAETRSRDRRSVLLSATPTSDGESPSAKATVQRLRARLPRIAGRDVMVGGVSALQQDFNDQVAGSMWKLVLFVLALSFVVLAVLLRSLVLPLKAVVMNLLSVGAAFGVLVTVFGRVDSLVPPFVLAIVFGLSMDYEVFLLSRIRERYEATGDSRRSVAEGLASSARTITGAAAIMVAVFAAFIATGVSSTQQLGVGLAVGVALDATVVRLVLVPATMELMGDWNWWLPRRPGAACR